MKYKWVVLFIVHASDDRTRRYANELFKILTSAYHTGEVKILVLYGSLQAADADVYKIQVTLKELAEKKLKFIRSYGYIDMGDDKKLGPVFSGIKDEYPSDRTLLFTWDHGSGFGVFNTNPLEPNSIKRIPDLHTHGLQAYDAFAAKQPAFPDYNFLRIITSQPVEKVRARGLKGMNDIEKKKVRTSMLTNDELRNIIKHRSESDKVDLLIMMNCMMQMIETGYALHDAVKCLVAPETCIFWAGYDYKAIIEKLCSDPEMETEAIARYAIDTIQSYYKSATLKEGFKDLVVSLVKPAYSKAVKDAIDQVAHELCDDLKAFEGDISEVRSNCEDLSQKYVNGEPYHYIDFLNFIYMLNKKTGALIRELDKIKQATSDYVVHMLKGSNYKMEYEEGISVVNGFTIYFPPTFDKAYNDYYYEWFYKEGKHQTRFADQCAWKTFLISYFKSSRYNSRD